MKKNYPVIDEEILVNSGDLLVSKTDKKGIIEYVSPDFCRICEFTPEEMIGYSHNIIRHPDVPPSYFQELWELLKLGRPWNGILKNRSSSGKYYWVEATITAVLRDGNTRGYISVRRKASKARIRETELLYRQLWKKDSGKSDKPE